MIRHPYNFVPLTRPIPRIAWPESGPQGHERFDPQLLSGTLRCALVTDTLLTIKANFEKLRRQNRAPYLPGSSLKGMTRNILEMMGAGCSKFFLYQRDDRATNLHGLEPCGEREACLVCRMFGYSVEGKEFGWAGKLRFHNSEPTENWQPTRWKESSDGHGRLGSFGTRHRPFYYPDSTHRNDPAGWKVYLHALKPTGAQQGFGSNACVAPGEIFRFRLDYENLTPEEFDLLHFALTLRHHCERHSPEIRLYHKLGYGKGLGLGSCHIDVERVEPENVSRFFDLPGPEPQKPGVHIDAYLDKAPLRAMQEFLARNSSTDALEFPEWHWFQGPDTKFLSIAEYELRRNRRPGQDAPEQRTRNGSLGAGQGDAPPRRGGPSGSASAASREPTPSRPPALNAASSPAPTLPKRVKIRITGLASGSTRGETVEAFEGHRYICKARGTPYAKTVGDECMVEIERPSVDRKNRRFEGKVVAS